MNATPTMSANEQSFISKDEYRKVAEVMDTLYAKNKSKIWSALWKEIKQPEKFLLIFSILFFLIFFYSITDYPIFGVVAYCFFGVFGLLSVIFGISNNFRKSYVGSFNFFVNDLEKEYQLIEAIKNKGFSSLVLNLAKIRIKAERECLALGIASQGMLPDILIAIGALFVILNSIAGNSIIMNIQHLFHLDIKSDIKGFLALGSTILGLVLKVSIYATNIRISFLREGEYYLEVLIGDSSPKSV